MTRCAAAAASGGGSGPAAGGTSATGELTGPAVVGEDRHACQPSDDAEAALRNLAAFAQFADPTRMPMFPPARQLVLIRLWWRTRIPRPRIATGQADLWPRPAPAVEQQRNNTGGRS